MFNKSKVVYQLMISSVFLVSSLFNFTLSPSVTYGETNNVKQIDETHDTDEDGLTDIFEFGLTNPKIKDSDLDGILDGEEDTDEDDLTNLLEQKLKINPVEKDSDGDYLNDYEEVTKYFTDPNKLDTDMDKLADGVEVNIYGLNPMNADEDGDNILDGDIERTYNLPINEQKIMGTATGKSNIPLQIVIRNTPILMMKQIASAKTFDIISLNDEIKFDVSIPYATDVYDKEDLYLFRYDESINKLQLVEKQKIDKFNNKIDAEFVDGGTFVVLSKSAWKETLKANQANWKGKYEKNKFKGKAKLAGIPGFEVDINEISETGTFTVEHTFAAIENKTLEGGIQKNNITKKAEYAIKDVYESEGTIYLTMEAITSQSGNSPTILIHGMNGSSKTWGFWNDWDNGDSTPDYDYNWQTTNFTGSSYYYGQNSTYSNIDVHHINLIDFNYSDSGELGAWLDHSGGYTPNSDLFIFEYYPPNSDDTVRTAANHLKNFIYSLRSNGIISSDPNLGDVNLVGHSMGGLVARYFIENLNDSAEVDRLITLGTPHFGSDLAVAGDLDREDSELWNNATYKLKNYHPSTKYIGFGGFDGNAQDFDQSGLRGLYYTGTGVQEDWSSWDYYVRLKFQNQGYILTWSDFGDNLVNIDSALGSDYDPDYYPASGGLSPIRMVSRYLIFDDYYGDHSKMRKNSEVRQMVVDVLAGSDDNLSEN